MTSDIEAMALPTIVYQVDTQPDELRKVLAEAQRQGPIALGPYGPEVLSYQLVRTALRHSRLVIPQGIGLVLQGITSDPIWDRVKARTGAPGGRGADVTLSDPVRGAAQAPGRWADVELGGGAHYCLGAHLARVELAEALKVITARMSNVRRAWPGAMEAAHRPVRSDGASH